MAPNWTSRTKPTCRKCGGFILKEGRGWRDVTLSCLNCGLIYYPGTYGWQAPWSPGYFIPAVIEIQERAA